MTLGNSQIPYRRYIKWVGRYSPQERILRLIRIVWKRGEGPGTGRGYSAKFSIALTPSMIRYNHGLHEWTITLLGLRLHYQRSYGGWTV